MKPNRLALLLPAIAVVMASALLLLAGQQASAQSSNCKSSSPTTSYVVTVCLTAPTAGATVSGVIAAQATISVTGANMTAQRAVFYLDGKYLLSSFGSPQSFNLPTTMFVDGPHTLAVEGLMRDGKISAQASIGLTFQNGVTQPPVNTKSFTPVSGFTSLNRPLIVAATGDGGDGQQDSADVVNVIQAANPDIFLFLGDLYQKGSPVEFYNWYGVAGSLFGKFRNITNPTVGNHEYENGQAPGYFDYWDNVPSYYSYNAAGWHFVSLNSNSQSGGYAVGTTQYNWLAQDLSANNAPCTVIYFHHPRYSVGPMGDKTALTDVWTLMAQRGVDIVLTGHDHSYQRWKPLDQSGNVASQGMTQFVAGGAGHGIQNFVRTDARMVVGYDTPNQAFGALRFEMNAKGAAFRYTNTKNAILDTGVVPCSGASPDTAAPSTPQSLTAANSPNGQLLQWQVSQDDTGVAGYTIYRNGAVLATVNGASNSFLDTTSAFNTTYTYSVDAFDPANHHSAQSNQASVTTPSSTVLAVNPSADTYVSADFPDAKYGAVTKLSADAAPTIRSYMRFTVPSIAGYISRATLRLYDINGSGTGYRLYQLTSSNWTELTTYNTAPAFGNFIGSSGAYTMGSWSAVDVTSLVTGSGVLEFGVDTTSTTSLNFGSRESANKPVLEIAVSSTPPPPPAPGTFTYPVAADSYVISSSPTVNYGTATSVKVDTSPDTRSYMRFNVQNLVGTVVTATLRAYATAALSAGYQVRAVSDNTWEEIGLTYNNAPPVGAVVNSSGQVTAAGWTAVDVTSQITGNGIVNLALNGLSSTSLSFDSREATNRPVLVVTTRGPDTTPPTAPGNLTVTAASATRVNLAWLASDDSSGIASYTIVRNGATVGSVNGATLSYADTSAQANTSYVYTVVAVDMANNPSTSSNQANVTTPPAQDTTLPAPPGNLTAIAASATQVNLAWLASTDSSGIASYTILRNGATVGSVNGATLSYADTSAQANTSYVYTVVALDLYDNESAPSNQANVATPPAQDTTPPTPPGNLTAIAASATQVNLAWLAATDSSGIASYTIVRNGATVGSVNGATLSYADTSAQANTSYVYTVVAVDNANNPSTPSNQANVTTPPAQDTTPPTAPGNLTAVAASATQVNLAWLASTDSSGIASYTIVRDGATVGSVNGATLSYADTSAQANTSYVYTVVAVDNANNSSTPSNQANVTTPPAQDTTPPTAPGNLTAIAASATQVNLAWLASTDSSGIASYTIVRNGATVGSVNGATLSYADTSAQANTSYVYTVVAVDNANNPSPPSNQANVTTPPAQDTTPPTAPGNLTAIAASATQVNLAWLASTDSSGIASYTIVRNGATVGSVNGATLSYADTSAQANTSYVYTVVAVDNANNPSTPSNQASVTTPPAPPPTSGVFTFTAIADTYVISTSATTNYGASTQLRADTEPDTRGYLRFDVQGLSGSITNVTLRVYATNGANGGYQVRGVADDTWLETRMNFNNAPAPSTVVAGTSGIVFANTWTSANATSLVTGNGHVNLALIGGSSTAIPFQSREGANRPVLVVTTGASGLAAAADGATATTGMAQAPIAPTVDSDGDGLSDADELLNGTKIDNPDTDGDGLPDLWEVEHGLNPRSGIGADGAQGDPDGDGVSNADEYLHQTEPLARDNVVVDSMPARNLPGGSERLYLPLIVAR